MSKLLNTILIIDVEATCWDTQVPSGQKNEIIEIGICILEIASGKRIEKDSIIVKPQFSQISPFCTQLTTLTQSEVNKGISLKDACKLLQTRYMSQRHTWASYGDYDRKQFEKECQEKKISYPFGPTHINIKNLLAITQRWDRELGMAEALAKLGFPLEGTHHRGVDDAWNIAYMLGWLLTTKVVEPKT